MSIQTLFGLILTNVIWSANPVMAKLVLGDLSSIHTAWVRYVFAFLAFVIGMVWLRRPVFLIPRVRRDWFFLIGIGLATFCLSPLMQMVGLSWSRATDNSLIIAMEPLITVFLAWIFLGEGLDRGLMIFFGVALIGFFLLSGVTASEWNLGNLIILASLTGEAGYSVFGRKLVARYSPLGIFGTGLGIGTLLLTLSLVLTGQGFPNLTALSLRAWVGILWLGLLGTTVTYLYWMSVISRAPVATLALTLFIQPLLGAACAMVFLGETLSLTQFLGGALILIAVFGHFAQTHSVDKANNALES